MPGVVADRIEQYGLIGDTRTAALVGGKDNGHRHICPRWTEDVNGVSGDVRSEWGRRRSATASILLERAEPHDDGAGRPRRAC